MSRLDDMLMGEWRDSSERARLVQELCDEKRRSRMLEDELRHRVRAEEAHLAGHPELVPLLDRIRELEGIVQRQNELNRRTA